MGIPVMVIGKSGSGKSTSMRNFEKDDITLINVINKPLPFRTKFTNTVNTDNYKTVCQWIKGTPAKTVVIDDAGYLLTNQFMVGHSASKGGSAVFDLYNEIADKFWKLINFVVKNTPEDKIVYFMMHEDKNDFGDVKPKTIGKLLDEKVCIEGMFTIVLRCITEDGQHMFVTKTNGHDVTKSPFDMFTDEYIDNDLKKVDEVIRNYYEIGDK